ncbi:hypothetical protein JCM12298_15170 [Desulfothermus naphthae]
MQYDIASKVILTHCRNAILRRLCGLEIKDSELVDVRPQETASVRRSDFVLRASFEDGTQRLVLLELITQWKKYLPLRTLETRCRHILEEDLEIETVMIELKRCYGIVDYYRDNEVEFRYKVVKLYELEAREVLKEGIVCLYPFVPLMKGGIGLIEEAEKGIYEVEESRQYKSDLLTGMAILSGLISREIPMELIKRRRDIMIESAAYEIIKREGFEEGIQQGIQQGIEQGIQQGIQQGIEQGIQQGIERGKLEGLLEAIKFGLELKFGKDGIKLYPEIKKIKDLNVLEAIIEIIRLAESVEDVKEIYQKVLK